MGEREKHPLARIIAVLMAVLLAGGITLGYTQLYSEKYNVDDFYDPMAVAGTLPGMSESEIQAQLNQVVEEGMMNISISSGISFANGKSKGEANIYNTEANHYIFKVAITLDDTGETVYQSKGIKPGQYIQYIKLAKNLEAGEYAATAIFTAYTQDTHQIVGSAGAQLTLYVESA